MKCAYASASTRVSADRRYLSYEFMGAPAMYVCIVAIRAKLAPEQLFI